MAKVIRYVYVARKPCGCLTAMAWDDPEPTAKASTAKFVDRCIRRGDVVERIRRLDTAPLPEWFCGKHREPAS